jgi:hypothetical protein
MVLEEKERSRQEEEERRLAEIEEERIRAEQHVFELQNRVSVDFQKRLDEMSRAKRKKEKGENADSGSDEEGESRPKKVHVLDFILLLTLLFRSKKSFGRRTWQNLNWESQSQKRKNASKPEYDFFTKHLS